MHLVVAGQSNAMDPAPSNQKSSQEFEMFYYSCTDMSFWECSEFDTHGMNLNFHFKIYISQKSFAIRHWLGFDMAFKREILRWSSSLLTWYHLPISWANGKKARPHGSRKFQVFSLWDLLMWFAPKKNDPQFGWCCAWNLDLKICEHIAQSLHMNVCICKYVYIYIYICVFHISVIPKSYLPNTIYIYKYFIYIYMYM